MSGYFIPGNEDRCVTELVWRDTPRLLLATPPHHPDNQVDHIMLSHVGRVMLSYVESYSVMMSHVVSS